MRVLFILGCNEGPSKRYRVFNHIEALKEVGINSEWIWDIHPEIYEKSYLGKFTNIVNFRGGFNERLGILLQNAKELQIPVIYDVDDLVFDESILQHVDAYVRMSSTDKAEYAQGVRSMRRALESCDAATASTPFLTSYIQSTVGVQTWRIPFGVNLRQIELAQILPGYGGGPKFITYLSGTKTHERDFLEAAEALQAILKKYKDVYLKVVGPLEIPNILNAVSHKIRRIPFMRWENLLVEASTAYINIAPFDPKSWFCQSKSNLKYIEAGLCAVPTIASPIGSFTQSIESGINGYIAESPENWEEIFHELIQDRMLRDRIGLAAREQVLASSTPHTIGNELVAAYSNINANYKK